jgi:hypothetical protein
MKVINEKITWERTGKNGILWEEMKMILKKSISKTNTSKPKP